MNQAVMPPTPFPYAFFMNAIDLIFNGWQGFAGNDLPAQTKPDEGAEAPTSGVETKEKDISTRPGKISTGPGKISTRPGKISTGPGKIVPPRPSVNGKNHVQFGINLRREVFEMIDTDGNGKLSRQEIESGVNEVKSTGSRDMLKAFIGDNSREYFRNSFFPDFDGDGEVSRRDLGILAGAGGEGASVTDMDFANARALAWRPEDVFSRDLVRPGARPHLKLGKVRSPEFKELGEFEKEENPEERAGPAPERHRPEILDFGGRITAGMIPSGRNSRSTGLESVSELGEDILLSDCHEHLFVGLV